MRISDSDGPAILSILAGGAAGLTMTVLLFSEADPAPEWSPPPEAFPAPVVAPAAPAAPAPPAAEIRRARGAITPAGAIWEIDRLIERQREVRAAVRDLRRGDLDATADRIEEIRGTKTGMVQAVGILVDALDRAAFDVREPDVEATGAFSTAAELIRESRLEEALLYSRGTIEQWDPQSALVMEDNILGHLRELWDEVASGMAPLVFVGDVEVEVRDSRPITEWVVRENVYDGALITAALDAWRAETGEDRAGLPIGAVEIVDGRRAVGLYGSDAAGGVVRIELRPNAGAAGGR